MLSRVKRWEIVERAREKFPNSTEMLSFSCYFQCGAPMQWLFGLKSLATNRNGCYNTNTLRCPSEMQNTSAQASVLLFFFNHTNCICREQIECARPFVLCIGHITSHCNTLNQINSLAMVVVVLVYFWHLLF